MVKRLLASVITLAMVLNSAPLVYATENTTPSNAEKQTISSTPSNAPIPATPANSMMRNGSLVMDYTTTDSVFTNWSGAINYAGSIYYVISGTNVIITGVDVDNPSVSAHLPDTINNMPVVGIDLQLSSTISLSEVYLPDTVTSVNTSLTQDEYGNGDYGFGCDVFVTENSLLTTIGDNFFRNQMLHQVGNDDELYIPPNVSDIGDYAFARSISSTMNPITLNIPASISNISDTAFDFLAIDHINLAAGNTAYVVHNNALYNASKTTLMIVGEGSYSSGYTTSFTIPNTVTNILPATLSDLDQLDAYAVESGSNSYSVDSEGVLFNKTKTELIAYPHSRQDSYQIPDGVVTIADYAFAYSDITELKATDRKAFPTSLTTIGDYAFYRAYKLVGDLTIAGNVETIGDYAFNSSNLENVVLEDGVKTIGTEAFVGNKLNSIYVPDSVVTIGDNAWSSYNSVTVYCNAGSAAETFAKNNNNPITYIADMSMVLAYNIDTSGSIATAEVVGFNNGITAEQQKNVVVPATVTFSSGDSYPVTNINFQDDAIENIETLEIGANVTYISSTKLTSLTAYTVADGNTTYTAVNGVLFMDNGATLQSYPTAKPGAHYTVPDSVTLIASRAFGSEHLTSVTIGDDVEISSSAFAYSPQLSNVIIGSGATIDSSAFYSCSSLVSVSIESVDVIGNNAFADCERLISVQIGAFYGEGKLGTRVDRNSVEGVFTDTLISDFYFPEGLKYIADGHDQNGITGAFSGLNFNTVVLPESLEHLGAETFYTYNNENMKVYVLNKDMVFGYEYVGAYTSAPENTPSTIFPNGTTVYGYAGSTAETFVADRNASTYQSNIKYTFVAITAPPQFDGSIFSYTLNGTDATITGFDDGKDINVGDTLTIPSTITVGSNIYDVVAIADHAFDADMKTMPKEQGSIYISEGITNIGDYAFNSWNGYTNSLYIPSTVDTIGEYAFADTEFASIVISEGVTTISNNAFDGAYNPRSDFADLNTINLPDSITTIGDEAFARSNDIVNITIPRNLVTLGKGAFSDSYDILNITAPSGSTNFSSADGVLFNADKTTLISFPMGKSYSTPLTSYTMPDSVTTVADYAMMKLDIETLTLSSNLTTIGEGAFSNSSFDSFTLPSKLTNIGVDAFKDTYISALHIPASLTTITPNAFAGFNVSTITVDANNPSFKIVGDSLVSKDGTRLVYANLDSRENTYSIPEGVVTVDDFAIDGSSFLHTLNIPASVNNIGAGNIRGYALKAIIVAPANTTYISVDDVLFNKSMTELLQYPREKSSNDDVTYTVPSTVTKIAERAFFSSDQLVAIELPSSLEEIGAEAFYSTSITSVDLPASVHTIGSDAFFSIYTLGTVTVRNPVISLDISDDIFSNEDIVFHGYIGSTTQIFVNDYNTANANSSHTYTFSGSLGSLPGIPISDNMVTVSADGLVYDGTAKTATVTVKHGDKTLVLGTDYMVSYDNNVDAGYANVKVTGISDYMGTVNKTFVISPKPITQAMVSVDTSDIETLTYNGGVISPTIIIKDGSKIITTYTVNSTAINAGASSATVTAKGNYTGTANISFTILPRTVTVEMITIADQAYTGEAITLDASDISIVYSNPEYSYTLVYGTDYTITAYSGNTNVGGNTASATISISNANYTHGDSGSVIKNFDIVKADSQISNATISSANITYGDSFTVSFTPTVKENIIEQTTRMFMSLFSAPTVELKEATLYLVSETENIKLATQTDIATGDIVTFTVDTASNIIPASFFDGKSQTFMLVWGGDDNLNESSATVTATLNKKPIAITAVAVDKVYDGTTTTTAALSITSAVSGVVATGTATFSDANVGTDKVVNITNIVLDGANSGYYTPATSTITTTGSITAKELVVTAPNISVYLGDDLSAPLPDVIYDGFVTGEDKSVLSAAYTAAYLNISTPTTSAGTIIDQIIVRITGTENNNNYKITTQKGDLTILEADKTPATPDPIPPTPTTPMENPTVYIPSGVTAQKADGTVVEVADVELAVTAGVSTSDQTKLDAQLPANNGTVYMEISLTDRISGVKLQPSGNITIFIPYSDLGDFTAASSLRVLHLKSDNTFDIISPAMLRDGITFTVNSLSPFAIYEIDLPPVSEDDTNSNRESDRAWAEVNSLLENAEQGDVITVEMGIYDKLPTYVMQTLRSKTGVTLVIEWDGGKDIVLTSTKSPVPEAYRVFYPLSYLANNYAGTVTTSAYTNPQTGGVLPSANVTFMPATINTEVEFIATAPEQGFSLESVASVQDTSNALDSVAESNNSLIIVLALTTVTVLGTVYFLVSKKKT